MYDYVVLPALIFLARITDVTIGTIRVILVTRGARKLAPVLGFFEVLIWLIVVSQVMRNLSNPACYIGYAAGFASGNFFGMWLEEKLAIGMLIVRVITPRKADDLIAAMNEQGYGATSIEATGANGHVNVIFSVVQRSELGKVVELIQRFYAGDTRFIDGLRLLTGRPPVPLVPALRSVFSQKQSEAP